MVFVAFVLSAPSAFSTLNEAIAAHGALGAYRAHVVLDATVNGEPKHQTYDIASDGKTALIRIRTPEHGDTAAGDRTLYFGMDRLVGYDADANERVTRVLPKKSLVDRVAYVLGPPDDMVKNILAPSGMQAFLLSMRKLKGWHTDGRAATPTVVRAVSGSRTTLVFLPEPGRLLSRVDVVNGKNEVHWRFDYASGGPRPLAPPASARLVGAFTVRPVPPHYKSALAKTLSDEVVDAYRRLTRGEIIVDGEDGHVELFIDGRKLREDQPHLVYAYTGTRLTMLGGRDHAFYAGASSRRSVLDYVTRVGGRVDPISLQLLLRRVPFADVFAPRAAVSYAGQMAMGQSVFEMLKVEYPGGRVSMFVRRSDHLLDSVLTESLDSSGHVLARSARRFRYDMLGKPQPDYRFIVTRAAGQAKLPLPQPPPQPKLKSNSGR